MPFKDKNSPAAKASRQRVASRYYEKHKAKIALKAKTDPIRLKALRINNWKKRGVAGDYDILYTKWETALKCENCNFIFVDTKMKCLDHNHDTGEFRYILCRGCNNFDRHLMS